MKKLILLFSSLLISSSIFAWTPVPDTYKYVTSVAADSSEQVIYVGIRDGGIWRTLNGGSTWEAMNETIMSEYNGQVDIGTVEEIGMYDAAGDTVYTKLILTPVSQWQYQMSMNGGEEWFSIKPPEFSSSDGHYFLRDQNDLNTWYLVTRSMFYKITNFGETWEGHEYDTNSNKMYKFIKDTEQDSTFYLAGFSISAQTPQGLWKSSNNGLTWFPLISGNEVMGRDRVYINDFDILANGSYLLTCVLGMDNNGANPAFYNTLIRSDDNGETAFVDTVGFPNLFNPASLTESSHFPARVFARENAFNNTHGLFRSTDSGRNFEHCLSGLPPETAGSFSIIDNAFNGAIYYCTTGRGVWKSYDGGDSWSQFDINLPYGRPRVFNILEDGIYTRGYNDRFLEKYDPEMEEWTEISVPASNQDSLKMLSYIVMNDGEHLYSLMQSQSEETGQTIISSVRSNDLGISWEYYGDEINPDTASAYIGPEVLKGETKEYWVFHLFQNSGSSVSVSPDSGQTWNTTNWEGENFFGVKNDTLLLSNGGRGVLYSVDNGSSWLDFDVTTDNKILFFNYNDTTDELFMFTGDSLFIRQGNNIERRRLPIEPLSVCMIPGNEPVIVMVTAASIFDRRSYIRISYDCGQTWVFDNLLADVEEFNNQAKKVHYVKYDPWRNLVWASTSYGMLYKPAEEFNSVNEEISLLIPETFRNLRSYPNPFNSSTVVSFTVERQCDIHLELFDILGRKIKTIQSGMAMPGNHSYTIDASGLSSGTYFITLESGKQKDTLKVSLIK